MHTDLPAQPWHAVSCSAAGDKIVALSFPEPAIYTLQLPLPAPPLPAAPLLSLAASAGTPIISWLVPSSSFVLQENSDLATTNWTDVPSTPSLNFTNLHYELTLSPVGTSRFYRLKQQ